VLTGRAAPPRPPPAGSMRVKLPGSFVKPVVKAEAQPTGLQLVSGAVGYGDAPIVTHQGTPFAEQAAHQPAESPRAAAAAARATGGALALAPSSKPSLKFKVKLVSRRAAAAVQPPGGGALARAPPGPRVLCRAPPLAR